VNEVTMTSAFAGGSLVGEARRSAQASDLLPGAVDFLFGASSWDDRCLTLTASPDLVARRSVLLLFEEKGETGRAQANDAILREYFSQRGGAVDELKGRSEDIEQIWPRVAALLTRTWEEKGEALDILVDLSACPLYLSLALLATGMGAGLIREARFVYNEAEYPDQRPDLFTRGSWEAVAVPGFVGALNPGRERFYVVSVGFEGPKTLRFVNRADPDRVAILFPKPGYRADYPDRTWKQNESLFEDYDIRDLDGSDVVCAPAGDAISAWHALSRFARKGITDENVYYLCCGPKPHSLALALRSMQDGSGVVVYPKPLGHRESGIRPTEEYWMYTIQDRSIPPLGTPGDGR
jgi:hypothetical protein